MHALPKIFTQIETPCVTLGITYTHRERLVHVWSEVLRDVVFRLVWFPVAVPPHGAHMASPVVLHVVQGFDDLRRSENVRGNSVTNLHHLPTCNASEKLHAHTLCSSKQTLLHHALPKEDVSQRDYRVELRRRFHGATGVNTARVI